MIWDGNRIHNYILTPLWVCWASTEIDIWYPKDFSPALATSRFHGVCVSMCVCAGGAVKGRLFQMKSPKTARSCICFM